MNHLLADLCTQRRLHRVRGSTMGTQWSVLLSGTLDTAAHPEIVRRLQNRLDSLCNEMSHWQADSLISKVSAAPAGWYELPADFMKVLHTGLELARITTGAYDPTLGELSNMWGFGPQQRNPGEIPPPPDLLAQALHRSGWYKTRIDQNHQAMWQPGGLQLDFSSIAKGYAVDCLAAVLTEMGQTDFLVEIGGELKAQGQNAHGNPWAIQVEPPVATPVVPGLPVHLNAMAIATSGNYRRVLPGNETRYWHTLDPRTGAPVTHKLASVSVLHRECMLADALATALLVMGARQGYEFAAKHNIAAVFMGDDEGQSNICWTPAFLQWAR